MAQRHAVAAHTPLKPDSVGVGCYVEPRGAIASTGKRLVHEMMILPESYLQYPIFIHKGDAHDELVSLTRRALLPVQLPDVLSRSWRMLSRKVRQLARRLGNRSASKWDHRQVISYYTGRLRARYERAYEDYLNRGLNRRDAEVSMFVKAEKWDPVTFTNKPPRAIQARQPVYGLDLARFIKPIEKLLYKIRGGTTHSRMIAKGLNQKQRANLLLKKWNAFDNTLCISLDCSKFDAHVSEPLLELEHMFYNMLIPDRQLKKLLRWQINNKGKSAHGIKYQCRGRRMSGDMNTASGNCILMVSMCLTAVQLLGVRKYEVMNDGDDCLLFIDNSDSHILPQLSGIFKDFGHKLTIESVARSLHEVEFCHAKIVMSDPPMMVRDPRKVLSSAFASHKHYREHGSGESIIKAIAECEKSLAVGIPVYQALFDSIVKRLESVRTAKLDLAESSFLRARMEFRDYRKVSARAVTSSARVSFELAFGIATDSQRRLEEDLQQFVNSHNWRSTCKDVLQLYEQRVEDVYSVV